MARKIMPKRTVGWRLAQNHGIAISNLGLVEAVDPLRPTPHRTPGQNDGLAAKHSARNGTSGVGRLTVRGDFQRCGDQRSDENTVQPTRLPIHLGLLVRRVVT